MNNKQEDPLLLDHEYDGIRELDNKLPTWWVWLFYLTIAYSAVYLLYYHALKVAPLSAGEYVAEMKAGDLLKSAAMGQFEASIPQLQPEKDAVVLNLGSQIYAKSCAACHRADGGGLVGPNLTDDYWIHGSNYCDTVAVIWNGVPAKGMITWKNTLKPNEVVAVASYLYTLRGAKLATPGKPPENQAPAKPAPSSFE